MWYATDVFSLPSIIDLNLPLFGEKKIWTVQILRTIGQLIKMVLKYHTDFLQSIVSCLSFSVFVIFRVILFQVYILTFKLILFVCIVFFFVVILFTKILKQWFLSFENWPTFPQNLAAIDRLAWWDKLCHLIHILRLNHRSIFSRSISILTTVYLV